MLKRTTLLLLSLFSGSVLAHNVWLEPNTKTENPNDYVVKFGHEQTESYPEHKITQVTALDKAGKKTEVKRNFKEGELYLDVTPATALVFVDFNNGVWSKLPSGRYVEKTKKEVPEALTSVNPLKVGKAIIDTHSQEAYKAHQQRYELIPQTKPEANKEMEILVLIDGKPAKGIKVGLGEDEPFVESNEKGISTFTPHKGYNKVWAEFEEPIQDKSEYDRRSIEYMLTFDAE